jgi:ribokinase
VVTAAARAAGGLVVLNAAPLPPEPAALAGLLHAVDVLVVNEPEALGLAAALLPGGEAGGFAAVARRLRELGPGIVVVTLGADGAAAADDSGEQWVPSYPVEVVDAVGAGDAFCAQLAIGLALRLPVADAVRRACAAGALATTGPGAQGAALDADAVDALVRR